MHVVFKFQLSNGLLLYMQKDYLRILNFKFSLRETELQV